MAKLQINPRKSSPQFWDNPWDYYDDLEEANRKYWNSKPLSMREEDLEEDMNVEVNQRDLER